MASSLNIRADETILFEGDVSKFKSWTSIKLGSGIVTNQRCIFQWGNESFTAEKSELKSVEEQKHGFTTKIVVEHKSGERVSLIAANRRGLKNSMYALAGMQSEDEALKQPEASDVNNRTAWVAAFGPLLADIIVLLIYSIMGWNLNYATFTQLVRIVLFKVVLIYSFIRIDYLSLQAQGFNPSAMGILPPEKFPVYLFSRAKAFGHGKAYAITWCVLIGIEILVLLV